MGPVEQRLLASSLSAEALAGLIAGGPKDRSVLPVLYEWLEERWPDWARQFHHQVRRRRKRGRTESPVAVGTAPRGAE